MRHPADVLRKAGLILLAALAVTGCGPGMSGAPGGSAPGTALQPGIELVNIPERQSQVVDGTSCDILPGGTLTPADHNAGDAPAALGLALAGPALHDPLPTPNGTIAVRYEPPLVAKLPVHAGTQGPAVVPVLIAPNDPNRPGTTKALPVVGDICPGGARLQIPGREYRAMPAAYEALKQRYQSQRAAMAVLLTDQGELATKSAAASGRGPGVKVVVMNLVPVKGTSLGFWSTCTAAASGRSQLVGQVGGKKVYQYSISERTGNTCPTGTIYRTGADFEDLSFLY